MHGNHKIVQRTVVHDTIFIIPVIEKINWEIKLKSMKMSCNFI